MDQFAARQQQIDQRRAEARANYSALWSRMVAEWNAPSGGDCAWLMYSANYLLRTGDIHWAIDPFQLKNRLPQAPEMDIANDLQALSFVLLTHRHTDHLDLELLYQLKDLPIRWVVPEAILPLVVTRGGIPEEKIIISRALQPLEMDGITITPFDGLHWEYLPKSVHSAGKTRGVPATAYLVEYGDKRWLFPGDTRTYDAGRLPSFGQVDGLFAHLWLGRQAALLEPPPLLDAFCTFCLDLTPRRVIVTHLEELGREADEFWGGRHYERVAKRFAEISPGLLVECAYLGERVNLDSRPTI